MLDSGEEVPFIVQRDRHLRGEPDGLGPVVSATHEGLRDGFW